MFRREVLASSEFMKEGGKVGGQIYGKGGAESG